MTSGRSDLARIYTAAIEAVDPTRLVRSYLIARFDRTAGPVEQGKWFVVGAGKAAARMAAGCETVLDETQVDGLVLTADGCTVPLRSIQCLAGGHPIPDERGLAVTARICERLRVNVDPVIVLISGGASALLVQPAPPITLAEKMAVNDLLLRSAVGIDEINCVRKHLSLVKGGGLLRLCRARPLLTLLLSDVVGDDPSVIGSGPTVVDPTTFADAVEVLRRHDLEKRVAVSVQRHLERGARGEVEETLKHDSVAERDSECVLLGNNRAALTAAAAAATALGYRSFVLARPLVGSTTDAAHEWLHEVRAIAREAAESRWCVVAGGETTVKVTGTGRGGRNQEFALALVDDLAGSGSEVLSAGTDGIDGPTDAAGAFVDGGTAARAQHNGLDPATALAQNDSYGFFAALGDLFAPGPTGTNVTDIKIAVGGHR
jgi:glycerate-2-kinase